MFQPEKFSDYIAILALLISCASFYLSWRNFRRDRSHLKLTLDYEKQKRQYRIAITNDGRRVATLDKVDALLWFRRQQTVFEHETELTEGKQKNIFVPLVMLPGISNAPAVRGFEAVDTRGNKYRASTFKLYWKILFQKQG